MAVVVEVKLWGKRIGAVAWPDGAAAASFEYDRAYVSSGIELAPLRMPLSRQVYRFPGLPERSFHGLPGMLADALPDKFGNAVIDAWLARQGRSPETFGPLDRLCYIGNRAMGALAHLDFNQPGAHGYEQAFLVMRRLNLPMTQVEEQFRRMVFNLVARNQDDHVKNIAFLMDQVGSWSLSPAYDVMWAFNPEGSWTSAHQMTVNGKRDGFTVADVRAVARTASLKRGRAETILSEVIDAVRIWPEIAQDVGVEAERIERIGATHRLSWRA